MRAVARMVLPERKRFGLRHLCMKDGQQRSALSACKHIIHVRVGLLCDLGNICMLHMA